MVLGVLSGVIPVVPVAARMDLGDFRLDPLPIEEDEPLVKGRVVDSKGAPVPSALVRWVVPLDPDSNQGWRGDGPMGYTQQDGTFTISGDRPDPGALLQVQPEGGNYHEPEAVPVPSENIVLRMTAGATLPGRVLTEDGFPSGRISVDLWNESQGDAPPRADVWGWRGVIMKRGRFEFDGLAPGSYTIRVAASTDPDPVVIPGIAVAGVDEVLDPRLDPVDLTGRYRVIELNTVDEEGAPVNATVYAFERGQSADGAPKIGGPRYAGNTNRGRLLSTIACEHAFIVDAEGFFPESLDPTDLPESIVLRRGRTVKLEWAGDRPLDELPFQLEVGLIPEQPREAFGGSRVESYLDTWSPAKNKLADAAIAGGSQVRVLEPGTYRLAWETDYEYRHGYHMNRVVELAEEMRIFVDGDDDLPVRVALPAEVIDREIAWMRERFEREKAAGRVSADLAFGEMDSPER